MGAEYVVFGRSIPTYKVLHPTRLLSALERTIPVQPDILWIKFWSADLRIHGIPLAVDG